MSSAARRDMTDRSVALHEAGHAVIARVLRMVAGGATIEAENYQAGKLAHVPEGGTIAGQADVRGFVTTYRAWRAAGRERKPETAVRAHIIMCMAGGFAGALEGGYAEESSGDTWLILGDMNTLHHAGLIPALTGNPHADANLYMQRLSRWARILVHRHADKIAAVADALVRHRTLGGADIDNIVKSTAPADAADAQAGRAGSEKGYSALGKPARPAPCSRGAVKSPAPLRSHTDAQARL